VAVLLVEDQNFEENLSKKFEQIQIIFELQD